MTADELKAWALGAGWTMVAGHPSLLKPGRKPGGAGGDAVVRLVLKATVAHVEAKKPAGKWEKLSGAAYAGIQPGEDGTPGGLLLDSIPGFRTLMQENRDRKVFAAFG